MTAEHAQNEHSYALGDDVIARIVGAIQDAILLASTDSAETTDVGDVIRQIRVTPVDSEGSVRLTRAYVDQHAANSAATLQKLTSELEAVSRGV